MSKAESCKSCKYRVGSDCRCEPPKLILRRKFSYDSEESYEHETYWPYVGITDWCGNYIRGS